MIRVLNRHVLREFLRSFLITSAVLTFVLYVGAMVQAIDYVSAHVKS